MSFFADIMLATHLICVNLAAGLPLIGIWLSWRARLAKSVCGARLATHTAGIGLLALIVGGLIGAFLGWLSWNSESGEIFEALMLMPSKLLFGVWELVFYVVCICLVWAGYAYWTKRSWWGQLALDVLSLAAATNLLWHFPPLFTVAQVLARSSDERPPLNADDFRQLLFSAEVFSLTVHVWLASLAVAGLYGMLKLATATAGRWGCNAEESARLTAQLARFALAASLLQIPVGVWVFLSLPQVAQNRTGGGDLITTLFFGGGILTALGLMHQLASLSIGSGVTNRKSIWRAAGLMVLTIVLMVSALRQGRNTPVVSYDAGPAQTISRTQLVNASG